MKYLIALAVLFFAYNVTAIESEPKRDAKFCNKFEILELFDNPSVHNLFFSLFSINV